MKVFFLWVLVDFNEMILLCLAAWMVMECRYLPGFLSVRDLGFPITSFKIIAYKKAWLWKRRTNFGEHKFAGKYKSLLSSVRESSDVWIWGLTFPRKRKNASYFIYFNFWLITTAEPQFNKPPYSKQVLPVP